MGNKKADRKKGEVTSPPSPDGKDAPKIKTPSGNAATATASTGAQAQQSPAKPLTLKERLLPEGFLLPWWVGLIFSVYALLKLGLTPIKVLEVDMTWTINDVWENDLLKYMRHLPTIVMKSRNATLLVIA